MEELEPTNPELKATIQAMRDRGIGILYGRWLIEGAPRVLLFDTKTAYGYLNEWKTDLWNVASIPSPDNDEETNEAIVFGYLVAWFLGEVSTYASRSREVSKANRLVPIVCVPREEEGCHCPLPRMACRCCAAIDQEETD